MKICFCLPNPSIKPIGGYKVVFEYANRLAKKGHEVRIAFNCKESYKRYKIPELIRLTACFYIVKNYPKWFELENNVEKIMAKGINDFSIPEGDIVIATELPTAKQVYDLSASKGRKYYLIQDFENWNRSDEEVRSTYELNMGKIVISKWLKKIVDSVSPSTSEYIPNGLDFNALGIDIPIKQRKTNSIAMLYHNDERKGIKYGLEVIFSLKRLYPDLEARLFGTPKRPKNLPDWIEYVQNANSEQLRCIYNKSKVFISTSIEEGFGLTGAESMACGCALVSTAHQGVYEYAQDKINVLLSPIKDVESLIDNVSKLFDEDTLRMDIATKGSEDIKKMLWENSVNKFENFLIKD